MRLMGPPRIMNCHKYKSCCCPMVVFSHHRGPEFGTFKCTGQNCTPKAIVNGLVLEKNVQILSLPTSALHVHDRDRNLYHEMKNRGTNLGCGWAVEMISTANAKHLIFATPLLLAESECEYSVLQFWL